jgi:hypothetical protein
MESANLINPVNLGLTGGGEPPPELSFKHQISLIDTKNLNTPPDEAPARGVAYLQLADGTGAAVGSWIKLQPYLNVYDQQAVDNYFNCTFDPIDDGNTEDDFFDPTDPDRRLGPSSTCKPEQIYAYMGDTFNPYSENRLGNAEGPGLQGSHGAVGTWVESKFNLERFRGRRARIRFLNTDLKAGGAETWEALFTFNPSPGDDGWWIDDVTISNTLTSPATVTSDDKPNNLPGCGSACNTVDAIVTTDPLGSLPAPGQVIELDALTSTADRCLNGVLQYRYWIDGNDDSAGGDPLDTLLRNWTDNPTIVDAPINTTNYVIDVRCSTATTCVASTSVNVAVNCPSSGNLGFPTVTAPDKNTMSWGSLLAYDWAKGDLALVGSYITSGTGAGNATSRDISADVPLAGAGLYYLFRDPNAVGTGFCNAPGVTWGSPERDAGITFP